MGIYLVECPACKRQHNWFSGQPDQRCPDCVRNSVYPGALMINDDKLRQQAEAASSTINYADDDGYRCEETTRFARALYVDGYLAHAARAEGLVRALEFYKNQSRYSRYYDEHEQVTEIEHDNGHVAREALAAYRKGSDE